MKSLKNLLMVAFILVAVSSFGQGQKFKSYLPTPPLGWNSWNTFAKDISEAKIMEVADAFISNGLKDAG